MTVVEEELEHEETFPTPLTEGELLSRGGEVAGEFCVVIRGSLQSL